MLFMSLDEKFGGSHVSLGSDTGRVVFKDGSAKARSFAEADGTRDDSGVEGVGQVLLDLLDDLSGKVGATIVHGHQHSFMP